MSKMLDRAKAAAAQGAAPHQQQLKKAADRDVDPADVTALTAEQSPQPRRAAAPNVSPKPVEKVPFGSYLDPGLHRQFKAICAWHGMEMQDGLEQALKAWVKAHTPS